MSWTFYDFLERGTRTKCDECGVSMLVQGTPETPCLCKRCSRNQYASPKPQKEPSVGRGRKSTFTEEEKAERRRQANKKYKETHREQANQYVRQRKESDPVFRLKSQTRNAIYQSFARTGNVKSERCERIVGLPIDDFVSYLCGTFRDVYGRDWDGAEKVQIDHIVPISTATNEEEVLRLCHYTNLRLITAEDNQRKGAKLDYAI